MATTYHHGNLRTELLDLAQRHLADGRAPEDLSLRALAREAGVSHGAPARHFPDRQALLDALAVRGFHALVARMEAAIDAGSSWSRRMDRLGAGYLELAMDEPALLDLMYLRKHGSTAPAELVTLGEHSLTLLVDFVAEGQREGLVRAGDTEVMARALFATVHGLAQLATGGLLDGTDPRPVLDELLTTMRAGWAPSPET